MMKRVMALAVVFGMIMFYASTGTAFADSTDAKSALQQLQALDDGKKALILQELWDYGIYEIANDRPVTVDGIFSQVRVSLENAGVWDNIAVDEATPGDGKISVSSIKTLIRKILNNKQVIIEYYGIYKDYVSKQWVKDFLGLPGDATEGQVYAAMLPYSVEILTLDRQGQFVRYGNVSQRMAAKLGIGSSLFEVFLGDINGRIDELAVKINNNMAGYGVDKEDMVYALEIYDLYGQPDYLPPAVTSTEPANGSAGIPVNKIISVTFNENVWSGPFYTNITFGDSNNNVVNTTNVLSGNKLTVIPAGSLEKGRMYSLTIPQGAVEDAAGNAAALYILTFTAETSGGSEPGGGGTTPGGGGTTTGGGSGADISGDTDGTGDDTIIKKIDEASGEMLEMGKELDTRIDREISADAVGQLAAKLKDISEMLVGLSDPDRALEKAESVIATAADAAVKIEDAGFPAVEIVNAIISTAEKVVNMANDEAVEALLTGTSARASVNYEREKTGELLKEIKETAGKLNDILGKNSIDASIEAVLDIDISSGKGKVTDVSVDLPGQLLKEAFESGMDAVSVKTGIAGVKIPAYAIAWEAGDNVTLEMVKEDNAKLEEKIRSIVEDNPVYDFNLFINGKKADGFYKPVEVDIPYTLLEWQDPLKITVFLVNNENELENVIGVYDEETESVKFTASHFSRYTVKYNSIVFNDLKSHEWARKYIEALAAKGVLSGIGNGKFNPGANVTRAEFASMVVRAFKLVDNEADGSFNDVNESDWFYRTVCSAVKYGIVSGRPDGKFYPGEYITRQDMAVIAANVLRICKGKKASADTGKFLSRFADRNMISGYAEDSAAFTVKYSIMRGNSDGSFNPIGFASRAEAAVVIYNLLYRQ